MSSPSIEQVLVLVLIVLPSVYVLGRSLINHYFKERIQFISDLAQRGTLRGEE